MLKIYKKQLELTVHRGGLYKSQVIQYLILIKFDFIVASEFFLNFYILNLNKLASDVS